MTAQSEPLAIGTTVKVNCYHGVIREVITGFGGISLIHPVYDIELDLTRRFSWSERRVYLPVGANTVRLFDDEFELLPISATGKMEVE